MKTIARVKKAGKKVTLIIPNFAAQSIQIEDGDILELEVKKGYLLIAKKIDNVKYIDSEHLENSKKN